MVYKTENTNFNNYAIKMLTLEIYESTASIALIFFIIFFKLLLLFLILTITIATITLMERKLLALIQRRMGPNQIAYKGRFQFIADALKLLFKQIVIIDRVNKFLFLVIPALILVIGYSFWINLPLSLNLNFCEIEHNLFVMGILSTFFSYLLVLVGFVSKNKYSILSSTRVIVLLLNLELLLNFFIVSLVCGSESLSFTQIVSLQGNFKWNFLTFFPVLPILFITFLIETGRIPFDLAESESELIAGYTIEFGGFYFALFYLGEYFHLYCFSVVFALCLFGGWLF